MNSNHWSRNPEHWPRDHHIFPHKSEALRNVRLKFWLLSQLCQADGPVCAENLQHKLEGGSWRDCQSSGPALCWWCKGKWTQHPWGLDFLPIWETYYGQTIKLNVRLNVYLCQSTWNLLCLISYNCPMILILEVCRRIKSALGKAWLDCHAVLIPH